MKLPNPSKVIPRQYSSFHMPRYQGWSNEKLIERINSLESQLYSESKCVENRGQNSIVKGYRSVPKSKKIAKQATTRPFDFSKYETRYVAFKFAYLGWHYNGLVTQDMATEFPTVEEEIFKALLKTRLIEHPESCQFSRCGRTDKGVSAMGQVMALHVRSMNKHNSEDESGVNELPWVDLLNGCLPSSIRILAYDDTIRPDFDARFNCRKRHYKYLICPRIPGTKRLNRDAMQEACGYLVGSHDYRNFCKLDAAKQISNFTRTILRCEVNDVEGRDLYVLDLEGSAFLWHQVRCITAILLLVGQQLESPEVVKELLDVKTNPTKPVYEMADDWPLTLYDCDFGDQVKWKYLPSRQRVLESAFFTKHEYCIKHTISHFMVDAAGSGAQEETLKTGLLLGDGKLKMQSKYVPIMQRKRLADVNISNALFLEKRERKRTATGMMIQDDAGSEIE